MPGHSLLKRLLVARENELGRKRLADVYISVATTFFLAAGAYSTLTYLSNPLPAISKDRYSGDTNLAVKPNAGAGKNNKASGEELNSSVNRGDNGLNDPESGVQLLIAIFKRVGGSQQIASINLKKSLLASNYSSPNSFQNFRSKVQNADQFSQSRSESLSERSFSKSISAQVAPDPALSIHPQLSKNRLDDAAANQQIASGSPNIQNYSNGATNGAISQDAFNSLGGTSNVNSGGTTQKQSAYNHEWYKAPMQVSIIDDAPVAKDRRQSVIAEEQSSRNRAEKKLDATDAANTTYGGTSNADNVAGIIRPSEQPGLFKYVREYLKEPALNAPAVNNTAGAGAGGAGLTQAAYQQGSTNAVAAAAPAAQTPKSSPLMAPPAPAEGGTQSYVASLATNRRAGSLLTGKSEGVSYGASFASKAPGGKNRWDFAPNFYGADSKTKSKVKYASPPTRLAFLPPNAVHGITGLPLGSTSSETVDFFKSRGKVSRAEFYGIQVLTLSDNHDTPLLQAFLREGHLEALRIFHPTYTPPQLGLNIGEELPSMKAKFGEPAFILEEPRNKSKAPPAIAKNYVYPISQVSFQLSRANASTAPQVISLMVFRFL